MAFYYSESQFSMTRKRQKAVKYVIYDLKNDVDNICNNTRMWMDGVVVSVDGNITV